MADTGIDRLFFENHPVTTLGGLQRNVWEYTQRLKDFLRQSKLFPKVLEEVTVRDEETAVEHGLGKVPVGWRVLSPRAPASVYQTRDPDTKYLYLANGAVSVTDPWAEAETKRLLALTGIAQGRAGVTWDGFHAPGKAAATANFGERWDVTVGAGAAIGHQTAAGAIFRNGVCVIEQNSGAWTLNQLMWAGPGLVQDDTTERAAIAIRFKQTVRPPANAFNAGQWGLASALRLLAFGFDETVDATYCILNLGPSQVVTTVPIADLSNGEHTVEIVRAPTEAGSRGVTVYLDGAVVCTTTTDGSFTDLKPWLYVNKGTVVFDDVLVMADAAFAAPVAAPDDQAAGSVVVDIEVV